MDLIVKEYDFLLSQKHGWLAFVNYPLKKLTLRAWLLEGSSGGVFNGI